MQKQCGWLHCEFSLSLANQNAGFVTSFCTELLLFSSSTQLYLKTAIRMKELIFHVIDKPAVKLLQYDPCHLRNTLMRCTGIINYVVNSSSTTSKENQRILSKFLKMQEQASQISGENVKRNLVWSPKSWLLLYSKCCAIIKTA